MNERIYYEFTREESKTIDRFNELHVFCEYPGEETDP